MKYIVLYLMIVSILAFSCCKKDEGCNDSNASISTYQQVKDRWFKTDTVSRGSQVACVSDYKSDSYEWLYSGILVSQDSFYYRDIWISNPVTLTTLNVCNGDTVKDVAVKNVYTWPVHESHSTPSGDIEYTAFYYFPIYGRYLGHLESSPNQKFEVTILDTFNLQGNVFKNNLINIPNMGISSLDAAGGDYYIGNIMIRKSPHAIYLKSNGFGGNGTPVFPAFEGYAWLEADRRKIVIEYKYYLNGVWIEEIFKGIRK